MDALSSPPQPVWLAYSCSPASRFDNDRIVDVTSGYLPGAPSDQLIDLKECTLLPGLIDCHTHITRQFSPKTYYEDFFQGPVDVALKATAGLIRPVSI
jgi:imidazolonepropionase-like amidohydrolase